MSHKILPHKLLSRKLITLSVLTILTGIVGFHHLTAVTAATPSAIPPAPAVDVVVLQQHDIRACASFSGRIAPV